MIYRNFTFYDSIILSAKSAGVGMIYGHKRQDMSNWATALECFKMMYNTWVLVTGAHLWARIFPTLRFRIQGIGIWGIEVLSYEDDIGFYGL